jgi:hypothetical protein
MDMTTGLLYFWPEEIKGEHPPSFHYGGQADDTEKDGYTQIDQSVEIRNVCVLCVLI